MSAGQQCFSLVSLNTFVCLRLVPIPDYLTDRRTLQLQSISLTSMVGKGGEYKYDW
jgi:hypothetical protein